MVLKISQLKRINWNRKETEATSDFFSNPEKTQGAGYVRYVNDENQIEFEGNGNSILILLFSN